LPFWGKKEEVFNSEEIRMEMCGGDCAQEYQIFSINYLFIVTDLGIISAITLQFSFKAAYVQGWLAY
jgi:hypothetical protein